MWLYYVGKVEIYCALKQRIYFACLEVGWGANFDLFLINPEPNILSFAT